MGRRTSIHEAATITGLTEYAIRKGIKERRYPYIRTGIGAGKIIIDIDLLERCLENEAMQNISSYGNNIINYGQLRRVSE